MPVHTRIRTHTPLLFRRPAMDSRWCTLVLLAWIASVHGQADVNEMCLGCMCDASSSCNTTMSCFITGGVELCGPFLISRPYWMDAGKPVLPRDNPNREGAFKDCVIDPYCAAATIRGYMGKYQRDCNGDRIIDCEDFARIHLMGAFGCSSAPIQSPYLQAFIECKKSVELLSPHNPSIDNFPNPGLDIRVEGQK